MAKEHLTRRETAERRVRQRHERERAHLIKERQTQRQELLQRYEEKLERLTTLRSQVADRRKESLVAHDRVWQGERARMASKTSAAPFFGLLGPSQRNLQHEYAERRERWEAHREAIKERFDQQLRLIGQERRSLRENHELQLLSHERWDRLAHDDLVRRQERSFSAAVDRELKRANRTMSRVFERHAGDIGRER